MHRKEIQGTVYESKRTIYASVGTDLEIERKFYAGRGVINLYYVETEYGEYIAGPYLYEGIAHRIKQLYMDGSLHEELAVIQTIYGTSLQYELHYSEHGIAAGEKSDTDRNRIVGTTGDFVAMIYYIQDFNTNHFLYTQLDISTLSDGGVENPSQYVITGIKNRKKAKKAKKFCLDGEEFTEVPAPTFQVLQLTRRLYRAERQLTVVEEKVILMEKANKLLVKRIKTRATIKLNRIQKICDDKLKVMQVGLSQALGIHSGKRTRMRRRAVRKIVKEIADD